MIAVGLGAPGWTWAEHLLHRFDGHGMRRRTRFSAAHHSAPKRFAPASQEAALATFFVPGLGGSGGGPRA